MMKLLDEIPEWHGCVQDLVYRIQQVLVNRIKMSREIYESLTSEQRAELFSTSTSELCKLLVTEKFPVFELYNAMLVRINRLVGLDDNNSRGAFRIRVEDDATVSRQIIAVIVEYIEEIEMRLRSKVAEDWNRNLTDIRSMNVGEKLFKFSVLVHDDERFQYMYYDVLSRKQLSFTTCSLITENTDYDYTFYNKGYIMDDPFGLVFVETRRSDSFRTLLQCAQWEWDGVQRCNAQEKDVLEYLRGTHDTTFPIFSSLQSRDTIILKDSIVGKPLFVSADVTYRKLIDYKGFAKVMNVPLVILDLKEHFIERLV